MTLNTAALKPPDIIESLDYEDILSRMVQDLTARDPEFQNLLESDPAMKILEVAAWRELLIRQRVNDAARSNLLAFAGGSDLEHLAAFYGVERLEAEDDTALKKRIQEKIVGWSTAGSRAHYRFHALSSDVRVRDARADSPTAGLVRVAVLSSEGNGLPSDELLQIVRSKVRADDTRVLTDTVEVVPCDVVQVDINADIYLYPETPESLMDDIRQRFIQKLDENRGLGWNLTRSWIIAHLFMEGVQRDLLPLLEGTTVSTKYGPVKTDHILFIASGAFHVAKPSDLLPELQGRLPNRVELRALTEADFRQILTETEASLIKQYCALMATEGVTLTFEDAAIDTIAKLTVQLNSEVENIGARRLQTVMEKLLDDISYTASDRDGESITITPQLVEENVGVLAQDADLSKFIL